MEDRSQKKYDGGNVSNNESNDAYSLWITDHDKPYFDFYVFMFFYDNINVKENVFFQSAS